MTSTPDTPPKPNGGLKIIQAAMMRSGTASLAKAYTQLGYKVHHALDLSPWQNNWPEIERAAEATWPALASLPEYTYGPEPNDSNTATATPRPRFRREDWDRIWGSYEVVTDLASPFVLELIAAYPDAKVVVAERDFDSWWASFEQRVLDALYNKYSWLQTFITTRILGLRAVPAMQKVHAGFFGTTEFSKESIIPNARSAHERYYAAIRDAVPEVDEQGRRRRMEYTLGSGWGPLCEFLGKEVPDEPFPFVNTRVDHREKIKSGWMSLLPGLRGLGVGLGGLMVVLYFYS
ncbi:hypothetical protein BJY00DRAFT_318551 [Aspergillus carlsbadensis]|nr:hypothetical protein BJY00DRAFT_318551 [Aspergillus carlsbadensis]